MGRASGTSLSLSSWRCSLSLPCICIVRLNTARSNPLFLFAWSLQGVGRLMEMTHLVMMLIITKHVLLFLSLEFGEGKSCNKPTSFLLLFISGMGPVRGKFWTATHRVIQLFQFQTKQLQPSVRAALSPPKPETQNKGSPSYKHSIKKPSQNYKVLHYRPLKTGTGAASFLNTFPYTKIRIFYALQFLWNPNIGKLNYTSDAI